MKRFKKFIGLLTAVACAVAMLLPVSVFAADGTGSAVVCSSLAELNSALAAASTDQNNPTVIALSADIKVSGQITIAKNTYVVLQSQGSKTYSIIETSKMANKASSALVYVKGNLTVTNLKLDAADLGRCVLVGNGATLKLSSGATVTGGKESGNSANIGQGVCVMDGKQSSYGTLVIEDGASVSGNHVYGSLTCDEMGIGIYLGRYCQFTMTGGKVSDNTDLQSGAVNTTKAMGGGIFVATFVTATISGGEISGNTAHAGGGGIFIAGGNADAYTNNSIVTLCGNAVVKNNGGGDVTELTAQENGTGGGIYMSAGQLYIKDNAVISGNYAQTTQLSTTSSGSLLSGYYRAYGGGIYLNYGEVYMSGGSITGNTASMITSSVTDTPVSEYEYYDGNGGGVYLRTGTFVMSGGSITGNKAESDLKYSNGSVVESSGNGGGVYIGFNATTSGTTYSKFIMTGGTISGNSADNLGDDIFMQNKYMLTTDTAGGMTVVTTQFVGAASEFDVSGKVKIGQVYLPDDYLEGALNTTGCVRMTVTDSLAGASIGYCKTDSFEGKVLAVPGSKYALTSTDAAAFACVDASGYTQEINANGEIAVTKGGSTSKTDISAATISCSDVTYNGQPQECSVSVVLNGKTLTEGADYNVTYLNNTNAGRGKVTVNGRGSYTGTATTEFVINPLNINSSAVTVKDIEEYYYTGSAVEPKITVYFNGEALAEGTDYSVAYTNNTSAGNAAAVITGKGNYTGSVNAAFTINNAGSVTVVSTETELANAVKTGKGSIVLAGDITLNSSITTASSGIINLNGNGHKLSMGSSAGDAMIVVNGSAALTLSNITIDAVYNSRILYLNKSASVTIASDAVLTRGSTTSSDTSANGQVIYNNGTLTLEGTIENSLQGSSGSIYNSESGKLTLSEGCLISNVKTSNGGAILNAGTAVMNGGTITAVRGDLILAAAISNSGTFTMNGGKICDISSSVPSIYNSGTFTMNGGTICGNTNSAVKNLGVSGGTICQYSGSFVMNGGEISENSASEGGAVLVNGGTFTMKGADAKIINNKADYVITTSTNVTNYGNGGAVFINNGEFIMENGLISGNNAGWEESTGKTLKINGYGGAIFINGGTLTLKGGKIENNSTMRDDDVYAGIYFGNSTITASRTESEMHVSGSPVVSDCIYMEGGRFIEITGALGSNASFLVDQENFDYGSYVAKYSSGLTGKTSDGNCFKSVSGNIKYSYSTSDNMITTGMKNLENCTVEVIDKEMTYTGRALVPSVKVTTTDGEVLTAYSITGEDNINAGTATVTITGDGQITAGTVSKTFTILPKAITDRTITVTISAKEAEYTGSEIKPDIQVKNIALGNRILTEGTDYEVVFSDNIEVGTAKAVVNGIGNYTGSVELSFTIKSADGWKVEDGNTYYYVSGKPAVGWQKIDGAWYYFSEDGIMQTGWVKAGTWYYMDSNGKMQTGWVSSGGKWYYMSASGAMATGWVKVGSAWYYMNGSGVMQTGWVSLGGKWYYMSTSGAMVTGIQTVDGRKCSFSESGVWLGYVN